MFNSPSVVSELMYFDYNIVSIYKHYKNILDMTFNMYMVL